MSNHNDFRWFVLYATVTLGEYNYFVKKIIPFFKNFQNIHDVKVDIIFMADQKAKGKFIEARIIKVKKKQNHTHYKEEILKEEKSIDLMMKKITKESKKKYDGIMLCSHSNGIYIGADGFPKIDVTDFIKLCRTYVFKERVQFFIFDCCYVGALESLFEISKICDYVLATPSYHDGKQSFLRCPYILTKYDDPVIWISKFGTWYINNAQHYASNFGYAIQWAVYSSEEIQKLGKYMIESNLYNELVFTKKTIVYWDDVCLHNFEGVLDTTIKKNEKDKKLIDKIEIAKLLLLKSYVYYDYAESTKKHKINYCTMSIHESLPYYAPNDSNCKLELFSKTYCKKI
jgi:hypothetical protein